MRITKLGIGLLLFVVLVVHPTVSNEILSDEATTNVLNAALPALAGLVGMVVSASPAGPFLVAGLGLVHVLSMILMGGDDGPTNELTKMDLFKTQQALMKKLDNIDAHLSESTSKIIRELTHTVESHAFLENMRNTLESLIRTYNDKMSVVLDPKMSAMTRRSIEKMLDYESKYRTTLRTFITTYIKPTVVLPTSGPIKLFFDFILQKNNLLAIENEDCHQDSLHYKIYKSFIFIAKTLTDAYAMALSAHVIQYQAEFRKNNTIDSDATKATAEVLLEEFKHDMKDLMEKTKWALENSSRDIKNCGSFLLKEGENYARLPFATTIPKIFTLNRGCVEDLEGQVSLSDYDTDVCDTWKDLIPANSNIQIYKNTNDKDRPFSHLKFETTTIGHDDTGSTSVFKQLVQKPGCSALFCPAIKKNAVGISLQRLRAKAGNVITGVRWRMSKNILYLDIQQGKFLNELEVDRTSVFWTETPEDPNQVAMLTSTLRKIEIGDHMLEQGDYLTSIQLKNTNQRYGLIKVFVEGSSPPKWMSFGALGSYDNIRASNEIKIREADDPARAPVDVKRLISKADNPKEPAYIQFQVSGFEKDFGRTTVPYIDTRPVFTSPPSPVVGFGIYHEAGRNDGGLLALKLVAPSLAHYIDYNQFEQLTKAPK